MGIALCLLKQFLCLFGLIDGNCQQTITRQRSSVITLPRYEIFSGELF